MADIIEITNVPKTLFERSFETLAAIDVLKLVERGEIATYAALEEKMGCSPQKGGRSNVNSARRYLEREKEMIFAAVINVGYKRLTDADIVKSLPDALTKSRRVTRRAAQRATCVEFEGLTRPDKVSQQVHLCLFQAIQAFSKVDAAKKLTKQVGETMRSLPLNQTLEAFKK